MTGSGSPTPAVAALFWVLRPADTARTLIAGEPEQDPRRLDKPRLDRIECPLDRRPVVDAKRPQRHALGFEVAANGSEGLGPCGVRLVFVEYCSC